MGIQPPAGEGMERLLALCRQLREHCPWDREQTIEKVEALVREEAAEIQAAVAKGDFANLREEIGDVLFNLLLLVRIAEERGLFTWAEVVDGEVAKMIRRHTHVYGDAPAATADEAIARFNAAKAAERAGSGGADRRKDT